MRVLLRVSVLCVIALGLFSTARTVAQTVNDCDRINQARALVTATTPTSSTGRSNKATILTRLQTLLGQVDCSVPPPPPAVLVAPTGLTTTAVSTTQVNVSWTDTNTTETAYIVEGSFSGAAGTFFQLASLGANITIYQNPGLSPATTYYWRVKARNAAGDSTYSVIVSGTTLPVNPPPPPPPPPVAQCGDGLDNDSDRLVDFPADPGCTSATDTDEANAAPPPPPPPPAGVIWAMDCGTDGTNATLCGWTGEWNTPGFFTKAYRTGGATGRGFVEFTAIPGTAQAQPYTGWGLNVAAFGTQPRFIRFALRIAPGFNPAGVGDVWTDKFIILGQGASDRMICVISPSFALSTSPNDQWLGIRCSRGIDNIPNAPEPSRLTVGQWHKVEVGVQSGGPITVRVDGVLKSSINNQTWNWPDGTVLGMGFYQNAAIAPGGSLGLGIGDAVWASTSDPNWR